MTFKETVLECVAALEPNADTGSIFDRIVEECQKDIAIGRVFVAVGELEREGLITVRFENGGPERGQLNRELCFLADSGRRALVEIRRKKVIDGYLGYA